MRLTDEQRLKVEYNRGKADGIREAVEAVEECMPRIDCFQEDGSVAYKAGDIIITRNWWQTLKKKWGIEQ